MKFLIFVYLIFSMLGCSTSKPVEAPAWYKSHQFYSKIKYDIFGYGQGNTLKEARANAKEDIAQTIISKIDSSFIAKTTANNTSHKDETKSILKVTSKLNLHNLQTIMQTQKNGIFYVALKYKNLDLDYRIKTTIGKYSCNNQIINNYLQKTPLLKSLTDSLGCQLNFKLDRKNKAWYLKYKEYLFLLSDDEFEELYVSIPNEIITLKASKKVLYDGDSFYFTFNSQKSGYITFVDVYENGIVTLLQDSTPIKNTLQIPSKKSKNYFEAGLVEEGQNTYDLYIAIYSEEPIDMSRFMYASEELAESEVAYKFDELIEFLKGYEYSSVLLRTKAK